MKHIHKNLRLDYFHISKQNKTVNTITNNNIFKIGDAHTPCTKSV